MSAPIRTKAISFIVPAYNEERELPATLRCIRDAAEQVCREYEIVVVNDGSTDATAELSEQLGARVLSIERRQIAAARNAGARIARGDILIFVDADTHIRAEHVRHAVSALAAGCAGGGARLAIDRTIPLWGRIFFAAFTLVYFRLFNLGAGGFLFTTRENFHTIGGFDENYFAAEEVFFTLALKKLGRFKVLPGPVITSGRKLRLYSAGKILGDAMALMFGGRRSVMSRRKLDLWYGGEREKS